ncbi:MAG: LamG domain-containing protein, partial [Planctomycetota bacterium]
MGGFTFANGSTTGPRGWLPRSLSFNGSTDYVPLPTPADLQIGPSHTVALWCRALGSPSTDQVIFEFGGSKRTSVLCLSGGQLHLLVIRNSQSSIASCPYSFADGWNQLVAVSEPGWLRLYVDGTECASGPISEPWDGPASNGGAIGASDAGSWVTGSTLGVDAHFRGEVADVAIFDRSLSDEEVGELFSGPEPTAVGVPGIADQPRVGEIVGVIAAAWESHQNGPLSQAIELQASPDGQNAWQVVTDLGATPGFHVP